MKCCQCKYAITPSTDDQRMTRRYFCQRYPPVPIMGVEGDIRTYFPFVHSDSHCGEFVERPPCPSGK